MAPPPAPRGRPASTDAARPAAPDGAPPASAHRRPGDPAHHADVASRALLDRRDALCLAGVLLLGILALLAFALHARAVTGGQGGVPLDDAWIHFQFARNLARGDGFAFNPGEPTAGSTAPLWTLLLAATYAAGGRFPLAGQLLSAAAYLGALAAAYALGRMLTRQPWTAALAAGVAALNGRLVWAGLSALETPLFAALTLLGVASHVAGRRRGRYSLRTAALLALATLARPEGALLFALSAADFLLSGAPIDANERARRVAGLHRLGARVAQLLPAVGLFAALVAPYVIFSLRTAGHALPNTFNAKARVGMLPSLATLSIASRYLILDNPLLLPFYVLGLLALWRRARVLSAWSAALPLGYALIHAVLYQHGRYLIPLIPANAVIAAAGLLEAARLARLRGWRWPGSAAALRALVLLLALLGTAWRLPAMARSYAHDVDNINTMHVALGRWVRERTPEDALVALNDIGAITYLSERRVVDLAGLVTPEVVPLLRGPETTSRLVALLEERGVDYVIIFPNWFPGLAAREDVLEPIHQVTLDRRTITGGETMVVYRVVRRDR